MREGWQVMKSSVRQVERLTFDMLYYVKDRPPHRELADPNGIIQEVVDVLQEMAAAKGVTLEADLDRDIGEIPFDRTAIYRAVLNLAANAVDACIDSPGGNRVLLKGRRANGQLTISVEDNGAGISPEIRANLFKRLFSTKAGKGTGLGLPVVEKVVQEHGGRIDVESEPGNGATFSIHLPIYDDAPATKD